MFWSTRGPMKRMAAILGEDTRTLSRALINSCKANMSMLVYADGTKNSCHSFLKKRHKKAGKFYLLYV